MLHGFATNPETLLFLAWAARQPGLREALIEIKARNRGKQSERVLRARLSSVLPPLFEQDRVSGPAYHRLFLHRLEQVEYTYVDWALRGSCAVYLKESSEAEEAGENTEASAHAGEETALLWEAISQSDHLANRLKRLIREYWDGNVHRGAKLLRLHFAMHMPGLLRTMQCPFLVQELLVMSLERVCWQELAARLLGVPHVPQPVPQGEEDDLDEDRAVCFATMLEMIWAARVDLGEFALSSEFAGPVCNLCADLAEKCADTHRELRSLWEQNGPVFAREREG